MGKPLDSIFFVGPMGAGKTTIGKLLAKKLGRKFIDSDWYIQECTGADIPWIFEKEGEEGFRQRETSALDELTKLPNLVLATGGGAVMRKQNRKMLQERGLVVYLNASVDVQVERTRKDKNRPLLKNPSPRQVLHRLYTHRHPYYQQLADVEVITGHTYPKQMVAEIIEALYKLGYEFDIQDNATT
ncbi:shikimate kinase AroK [Psychrobacter sp. HD31]|uniref:shikimate kinase AroK n=1 Tax=Psychrobacter sp. HD31 TaxID=3112003 RepID=UPI003DA3C7E4